MIAGNKKAEVITVIIFFSKPGRGRRRRARAEVGERRKEASVAPLFSLDRKSDCGDELATHPNQTMSHTYSYLTESLFRIVRIPNKFGSIIAFSQ